MLYQQGPLCHVYRSVRHIRRIRPWEATASWSLSFSTTVLKSHHLVGGSSGNVASSNPLYLSWFRNCVPQQQQHYFSSKTNLKEKVSSSRRRKLRENRRKRRLRRQEESVRDSLRGLQDLPRRNRQDFENFFDAVMPPFTLSQMDDVLGRIQSKATLASSATDALPLPTILQTVLHTTNPSDRLQIQVLRFLLYNDQNVTATATNPSREDVLEPHVLETWVEARNKSIVHPLFWNQQDLRHVTSDRLLAPLQEHQSKTAEENRAETQALLVHLRQWLPNKYFRALLYTLESYVGAHDPVVQSSPSPSSSSEPVTLEELYEPERAHRPLLRLLEPTLARTLKSHVHLVGHDIARYFYLADGTATADLSSSQVPQTWIDAREKFTTTLIDLQEQIFDILHPHEDAETTDWTRGVNGQLDMTASESQATTTDKRKTKSRRRTRHVEFRVSVPEHEMPAVGASLHRVFLDNLPIDATEDEIRHLYSRCGPVKSVQIYNKRPDLDPGPLTVSQAEQRRRKALKTMSSKTTQWQRPRTPVYGLVEFVHQEGYQRAIDDTLRIFGMLIRRHPVRSMPAARLTCLYLENLTRGELCLELGDELEHIMKMQVSLEPGQKSDVLVGSCEITFPSFEVAWEAYSNLQSLSCVREGEGQVNWFRAPKDAQKWWTRERGFDF